MNYDALRACRLFVLDMDGTLYLGDRVFDGAVDFIRMLERSGRRYIYLTNKSSRACSDYIPRLQDLGFPCTAETVMTPGTAMALYLNEHFPGQRICLVGNRALRRELESYGITVDMDDAGVVAVGFDTELDYHKLDRAVHFLRKGAPFLACNPDWVCPMPENEVLPDCGSICALLTAASGVSPLYLGKPNRGIVDILSARTGIPQSEICCVGDRLYTDIAVGRNAGTVTALVLSGETTADMLPGSEVQPDYVFSDVAALAAALERRN